MDTGSLHHLHSISHYNLLLLFSPFTCNTVLSQFTSHHFGYSQFPLSVLPPIPISTHWNSFILHPLIFLLSPWATSPLDFWATMVTSMATSTIYELMGPKCIYFPLRLIFLASPLTPLSFSPSILFIHSSTHIPIHLSMYYLCVSTYISDTLLGISTGCLTFHKLNTLSSSTNLGPFQV